MEVVLLFLGLVSLLLLLAVAARRWGVNSQESFDSAEWEKRRHWNL